MRVGVVAVQGGVRPHFEHIEAAGDAPFEVQTPTDLERAEAIVLVGGESTAQVMLLDDRGLTEPLIAAARQRPTLATCAGLILAARWGLLDIDVERNGFGSQVHSFEAVSDRGAPLVFIRAPKIVRVGAVEVLDTLDGDAILVRAGTVTGATYHPELVRSSGAPAWRGSPSARDRSAFAL